jgi:DNA-binding response OmpR family regulator
MNQETSILVVDDDPDMLFLSTTLLTEEGYEVLGVTTGKEGLDAARTHHPDIIMLDVELPDTSGIEVCRQIKDDSDLKDIFVVLVSGSHISSDYQADGLNTGADGYIVKGITNKELIARLNSVARLKHAEDALRAKETEQGRLISELQKALSEIKTLKGLIPICASCKKIRDDQGYWDRVESYITHRTEAVFTHGICPDCAEKLYPGYSTGDPAKKKDT